MEPICLIIHKLNESESFVYYHVEDCINKKIFNLGIDMQNKSILYFDTDNFDNPIGKINLSSNKVPAIIPGIENNVVLMLSAKMLKAIRENIFPDDLSILTH